MEKEIQFEQTFKDKERETIKESLKSLYYVAQSAESEKLKKHLLDFVKKEMEEAQLTLKDIGLTEEGFEK